MKPETTEDALIRVLLIIGFVLALLGSLLFLLLALGVDVAEEFRHVEGYVRIAVQYIKHLF